MLDAGLELVGLKPRGESFDASLSVPTQHADHVRGVCNTWHALLRPHIVQVGSQLECHGTWPSLKNTSVREWEHCRGRDKGCTDACLFPNWERKTAWSGD